MEIQLGSKFGKLTIIRKADRRRYYLCRCDCGTEKEIRKDHLTAQKIVSCGCHKNALIKQRATTHGKANTPEYRVWNHIIGRCTCKTDAAYDSYGGRGITVCDRWTNSFEAFLHDMGPRPTPKHQIDRIDNDAGYSPENCRWVLAVTQANNKRNNVWLTHDGLRMTISQWERHLGLPRGRIDNRLRKGWSAERALSAPVIPKNKQKAALEPYL